MNPDRNSRSSRSSRSSGLPGTVVADTIQELVALAMIIGLLTAGFAGSVLPVVLQRIGFDPAVASSALPTSIADVVGFYVFLGLAAALLP